MGAQDEYLRNFCILLTEKGVVPMTDPLQISVYNSLLQGMKRPSDLTSELGLSSSSLHFVIDKMSESGIIDRIKPESDRKTVYYSTNAKVLASSVETNEKLKNSSQIAFTDPLKNYKGLSSLSNMLDCYMSEIGVNIDPIRMKYANALADCIECEKAGMEDAILEIKDSFCRITGCNFTVFSFSPLTFVVSGDEDIRNKAPVLMRFLIRLIENATGKYHRITSIEAFNGSETMIKVSMERAEREEEPYINTSLHHKECERFMMVDVDGTAGLMTSTVQMDIIDAIYERPLCITDIVNRVDSPRSTITSNLLRMVEEGVISVFYSESGSAYYGLACSILLKKSREISADNDELNAVLDSVKDKEGAFLEGQLLYTLAYLKKLGFDSEYIMVVLGAKYMRSSGSMDVQGSFDTYFGKMSDIAQAVGLSLNIVSVYPLTIGITSSNPDSSMLHAMTFIKGMAHQGLEMASSGIFVRICEESETEENISFREIYPALSMKPVKGVMVENLSPAATTKKRTSSVKTALLNRSKKDSDSPARMVRYITAAVFLVMLSAILVFGVTDTGSDTDASTYEISFEDGLEFTVYDANGKELSRPYIVTEGTSVVLTTSDTADIGYVQDGIAYPMDSDGKGNYLLKPVSDIFIEKLYPVTLDGMACSFAVYSSSKTISSISSVNLVDASAYREKTGNDTVYVSYNNKVMIYADEGYYILSKDDSQNERFLLNYLCDNRSIAKIDILPIPVQTRTIDLGNDAYYYSGHLVTGEIVVDSGTTSVELRYAGDKNVIIKFNGSPVKLNGDNSFVLNIPAVGDMRLSSEESGFY